MKKKLIYLNIFLFLLLILSVSCVKNVTCTSANNLMRIEIWSVDSDTIFNKVTLDSLTLYFEGKENELVYDNQSGVSIIEIPLADTTENLKLILRINDGMNDELRVNYKPYFVFRSTECGVINRYEIIEIEPTNNEIRYIETKNEIVDESKSVNLRMVIDAD